MTKIALFSRSFRKFKCFCSFRKLECFLRFSEENGAFLTIFWLNSRICAIWWYSRISYYLLTNFAYFPRSFDEICILFAMLYWNRCFSLSSDEIVVFPETFGKFYGVSRSFDKICGFFAMFSRNLRFFIIFYPRLYDISNPLRDFLRFFDNLSVPSTRFACFFTIFCQDLKVSVIFLWN